MTPTPNTILPVDNPLGLFDGCWVKLANGQIVHIFWNSCKCVFFTRNDFNEWHSNGFPLNVNSHKIISLATPPREPVKVPEPWTSWVNVYSVMHADIHHDTKADADRTADLKRRLYTLKIKCTVEEIHMPDGTVQEVPPHESL